MRKILFLILIVFSFPFLLKAQNTGFAGKRLLLKSNAINGTNGLFNSYAAEFAFHRNMTVTFGYDAVNKDVLQSYNFLETVGSDITMSQKARTSYRGINMEFRKYLFSEKPAPYGLFLCASFANGNLNIEEGTYSDKLFIAGGTQDITYKVNGINVSKFGLGFGYQKPINKWLFVGTQLTFDYVRYGNVISGLPQQAAAGVLKNYGSNFLTINFFSEERPIQDQQLRNYGVSGNIQVGILLF
jgi:hypothetical protein